MIKVFYFCKNHRYVPVSVSLKTLINWIYGAPAAYCIISVCVDSFPLLKPRNDMILQY